MTEYPLMTVANERARDAFYQVNEADDGLLRSVYSNGCTLAEAIGFFETLAEFEALSAAAGRQYIANAKINF